MTIDSSALAALPPAAPTAGGFHLASPVLRSVTLSSQELANDQVVPQLPSKGRRYFLLALLTLSYFLDVWCGSAAYVAISHIGRDLNMELGALTWIPNSYGLTLASFLLTAGRISDICSPKLVFIFGFGWLGILCLAIPFSPSAEVFLTLRALSGIGAALSIPSALALIIHLFPDPKEKSFAISLFSASGALGNLGGLILGGLILLESWKWIYWILALISLPTCVLAALLVPNPKTLKLAAQSASAEPVVEQRKPRMDWLGTFLQTAAIVLFVFGLTQANVVGWDKPITLAPLIIGAALFGVFIFWEGRIDPIDALVHPSIFRIRNVALLAVVMCMPGFYWTYVQVFYATLMQDSLKWMQTPIQVAVRFIPLGVFGGVVTIGIERLPFKYFPLRYRLASGALLGAGSSALCAYAYDKNTYFSRILPSFLFGTGGISMMCVSAQVAMLSSVPPKHAGVAGGVMNTALQLGQAAFLALATTLQVSYPPSFDDPTVASRQGWTASFLFGCGVLAVVSVLILILFRDPTAAELDLDLEKTRREEDGDEGEDEKTVGGGTLGTQRTLAGDVGAGKKMDAETLAEGKTRDGP